MLSSDSVESISLWITSIPFGRELWIPCGSTNHQVFLKRPKSMIAHYQLSKGNSTSNNRPNGKNVLLQFIFMSPYFYIDSSIISFIQFLQPPSCLHFLCCVVYSDDHTLSCPKSTRWKTSLSAATGSGIFQFLRDLEPSNQSLIDRFCSKIWFDQINIYQLHQIFFCKRFQRHVLSTE